jgi:hypothetical protein
MLNSLLALALLSAPDAGPEPSLSFADVRAGDYVAYDVDGKATLRLYACAVTPKTVTLAISVKPKVIAEGCKSLLDGALVEVPVTPLKPAIELPQPDDVRQLIVKGQAFPDCGSWSSERTTHGPRTHTTRCISRELVLGGGLVNFSHTQLTIQGRGDNYDLALDDFGNSPGPCPSWPRAPLGGWWRESSVRGRFRTASETAAQAGSAWVRTREQSLTPSKGGPTTIDGVGFANSGAPYEHRQYLVQALIPAVRALPGEGKCTPTTLSVGGAQVGGVKHEETSTDRYGTKYVHTRIWALPTALSAAPYLSRIRPVLDQWVTEDAGGKSTSRERLEAAADRSP